MARLLVIDDEKGIRDALVQLFEYEGHDVMSAEDGREGIELADQSRPDVIFLDVKMPGLDGLDVLARLHEADPTALVVMISGHGTIDTAVEATRKGAYDFLEKPLDSDRLLVTLRRALELKGLTRSMADLKSQVESRYEIVGTSFAIRQVLERVEKVAPTEARVLITGENGTGKEMVAKQLHVLSRRSDGPFVEVNCAAIPEDLIESELFGHEKGSFTGATEKQIGKFEQADRGTIFLDEVGDMSAKTQAKVLRVLQEQEVERLGSARTIKVDVRVIAATNQDLEQTVRDGKFREDLYYRLNVVNIQLPALRDRREDIPLLVEHFLRQISTESSQQRKVYAPEAVELLVASHWPGNIRQLYNVVRQNVALSPTRVISAEHGLIQARANYLLLQTLMESAGRVLSRERLLSRVWGYARADEIESRTVDVHVRRLRAKLGDEGRRIATVKSVGYRFETG